MKQSYLNSVTMVSMLKDIYRAPVSVGGSFELVSVLKIQLWAQNQRFSTSLNLFSIFF